ncbi:MAG TPA: aldo/keto reductase [Candidatus Saccharimonadales bacterium]
MSVPNIKLADGTSIPQFGLGLWKVTDEQTFSEMFDSAIDAGYRMFDSAQIYKNEQLLGSAIKASRVSRSELYITTKISVNNFGYKKTLSSFKTSMEKLDIDYVDLLLLHFPVSVLRKKSWKALEEIQASGQVKSIGVSNYTVRHLKELSGYAHIMPVVNQVELHLFLQQPELVEYCINHRIAIEAYSPLAHGKRMDDDIVLQIANKHEKTYAQIMLRFLIQLGMIVIPKSVTKDRIEQNINIFDFKLDGSDMKVLKSADRNLRTCWNPTLVP